jgi:hypothetical protein
MFMRTFLDGLGRRQTVRPRAGGTKRGVNEELGASAGRERITAGTRPESNSDLTIREGLAAKAQSRLAKGREG